MVMLFSLFGCTYPPPLTASDDTLSANCKLFSRLGKFPAQHWKRYFYGSPVQWL